MTKSVNFFLLYKNLVTNRAVLTFGKACFRTGSSNRLINNLGVRKLFNYCLSNKNCITNRAVLTFGKTCCCASRSLCRINNLSMTESLNCVISINMITADTCICCITVSLASRISNYCIVLVSKSLALSSVTSGACFRRCTSSINPSVFYAKACVAFVATVVFICVMVTGSFNNFCFCCSTNFTSKCLNTCLFALRLSSDYTLIPSVTCSCNCFLCNKNYFTNRAVLTFCKTCFCTGSSNRLINNLGMTKSFNCFLCNENRVTNGAVLTFSKTCIYAIGSNCLVSYFGMTKRVNCNSLSLKLYLTYSTVNYVIVFTCIYAIGSNVVFNNNLAFGMTESVYVRVNVGVTAITSMSCVTLVNTVRIGNNCIVFVLAYCVNVAALDRVITISKLVCVIAVICMVSGVEVNELTACYVEYSAIFLFAIVACIENVVFVAKSLSSLKLTAVDINVGNKVVFSIGSCKYNVSNVSGVVITAIDSKSCAVESRNNGVNCAICAALHFAATNSIVDGNSRADNVENFNYVV